jgi:hypothetical protein
MSDIIHYPRRPPQPGPSPSEEIATAWAVADRLARLLVEADRDLAWGTAGTEAELMLGPERPAREVAESMGLIYTLRVALGIIDEAGNPI